MDMCGRFELTDPQQIYRVYHIKNKLIEIKPNVNVSPSQYVPVVLTDGELVVMKWGLIPHWAKDAKIGYKMINARKETLAEKPSFRVPLKTQRCIIPATGFYEWKTTASGKVPYKFSMNDHHMFGFAGLYEVWKDPEGEELKTFTIITVEPNNLVGEVHNRMPAILTDEEQEIWLNPDETEPERLLDLLHPYPENRMIMELASKDI